MLIAVRFLSISSGMFFRILSVNRQQTKFAINDQQKKHKLLY